MARSKEDDTEQLAAPSQADLLKRLLPVSQDVHVFATPSFADWLGSQAEGEWPPPASSDAGLWLVDTRDPISRARKDEWKLCGRVPNCVAAVILAGSRSDKGFLRRLLRKMRLVPNRRLPPEAVESALGAVPRSIEVTRLGFEAGPEVPAEFVVEQPRDSSGQAFLLSRRPPFIGPMWTTIEEAVGEECRVLSFEMRVRGAAIVHVETGSRSIVVRVVPPGSEQELVHENHVALRRFHDKPGMPDRLRGLIPEPVFEDTHDSTLLLGETRLPGTLAWKLASGPRESTIHDGALRFLADLEQATRRAEPLGAGEVEGLIQDDLRRLEAATFAGDRVRALLGSELRRASDALEDAAVRPHATHGDYGYGNLLVDPDSGRLSGVIDWGTSRAVDFPGIDRVNLEVQRRRTLHGESFSEALRAVWRNGTAHEALTGPGRETVGRALFALAACRYVLRSLDFPEVYGREEEDFRSALLHLARIG